MIWTAAALASVTALMALAPGSEMILQSITGRIDPRARCAGRCAYVARNRAAFPKPAVRPGDMPENKRDKLLGRYFAGRKEPNPTSAGIEADAVAAGDRSRKLMASFR